MSVDNKPNLVGWAAVLTGIAAIITAIGFPEFLPDLTKQFFGQDDHDTTFTNQHNHSSDKGNPELKNNFKQSQESNKLNRIIANKSDNYVVVDDVRFESLGCEKSSQRIKCILLATNQTLDKKLKIYTKNVRIIASGDEYIARNVGIGNIQTSGSYQEKKLVQNIPIKIFVDFEGIKFPLSNIDLLEIVPSGSNSIQIRDVQLSQ